jgi:glycosyltransferase involved in cell wall biosynthesis
VDKPIRILEVIKSFNIEAGGGGAERFAIELAQAIDQEVFNISICSLWDYATPQEKERRNELSAKGISAFTAAQWDEFHPYRSMWQAMDGLRCVNQHQPFDIVNTHSEFADIAALRLWVSPHRPHLIRTMHYSNRVEWADRPLRRYFFSYFLIPLLYDKEIGVSQKLQTQLDRRLIARLFNKKAYKVYNAVNLDRFKSAPLNPSKKRSSLGLPADAFIIGSIGRLTVQKGYSYLIEAATKILERNPKAYFLIIGDGELADELKNQAAQKSISSHLYFSGGRRDVEELLACMDLFVCSSLWEGLPTVILESMAAGVPILATDIPGIRELIQDQKNGWLVPAGDANALARGIQVALEDAKSRQAFIKHAQQDVQHFSIRTIASEYEKIYSAAMNYNLSIALFG